MAYFMLCIFYSNKKKEREREIHRQIQTHKEKTEEKTTATEFWKLEMRFNYKPAVGKVDHSHFHHRILPRLRQCCLSGRRGGIHCGGWGGAVLRGAGSPPPPHPRPSSCCWVAATSCLCRNMETFRKT